MASPSSLVDSISPSICTICLDPVVDDQNKGIAKLKCGHIFHLGCIGSAFNAKNEMKCPNCRDVENGDWFISQLQGLDFNQQLDIHELLMFDVEHYDFSEYENGDQVLSPEAINTYFPMESTYIPPQGIFPSPSQSGMAPLQQILALPAASPFRSAPQWSNPSEMMVAPIFENYFASLASFQTSTNPTGNTQDGTPPPANQ